MFMKSIILAVIFMFFLAEIIRAATMYGMDGCTEMKTGVYYGLDGMYGPSPRVYELRKCVCKTVRKYGN